MASYSSSSSLIVRITTTAICIIVVLLSATTVTATVPPWMLGDEQTMQCWFLNKTEIKTPPHVHLSWVTSPPEDATSEDTDTTEYTVKLDDAFWTHDHTKSLLQGDLPKWQKMCTNESNTECTTTNPGACCVFHSNIHSCRANTGVCEPWVMPQNCSTGNCVGSVLVTHTASQVGGAESYFHDIRLPEGEWIIIAHIKIMNFQCAVGVSRLISPPKVEKEESKLMKTVVLAISIVFGILVFGAVAVVCSMKWKRMQKVAYAPKNNESKIHTMFVQLKRETLLWESAMGENMPSVMYRYHQLVTKAARDNHCYVVKHIGGATLIAARTGDQILDCAAAMNKVLQSVDWSDIALPSGSVAGEVVATASSQAGGVGDDTVSMKSSHSRSSHTSRVSYANRHRRRRDDYIPIEFSIGVHCDRAVIHYNSDHHAYDYTGPAVTGAAVASDRAHGDQILVTTSLDLTATAYDEDRFVEFCACEISGDSNAILLQFTPPNSPLRVFAVPDEDDEEENVDSIAAVIEQQTNDITCKKVTAVSILFHQLDHKAKSLPREAFSRLYHEKIKTISECVAFEKGHIHSFVGPRVIITFNAVQPTPQATMRAYSVVDRIKEMEMAQDSAISAGIATEVSIVGKFNLDAWHHDALVSKVTETATLLQRLCALYPGVHCLASQAMFEELNCFAVVEYVDILKLPETVKPRLIIAIHSFKADDETKPQETEWMYELDASVAGNKYFSKNNIYDRICNAHADSGLSVSELEEAMEAITEKDRNHAGYVNLVELVACVRSAVEETGGDVTAKAEDQSTHLGVPTVRSHHATPTGTPRASPATHALHPLATISHTNEVKDLVIKKFLDGKGKFIW